MDTNGIVYLGSALAAVAAAITAFFALTGKGPRGSVLILGACIFTWGAILPFALRDPVDGTISRELDLLIIVLRLTGFIGALLGVFDVFQKRPYRDTHAGLSVLKLEEWILEQPLVWGGILAANFYLLLASNVIDSPLLHRYLAGHPVEYVVGTTFFIGLAALALRFLHVTDEFMSLEKVVVDPSPRGGQQISACSGLLEQLAQLPQSLHESYLVRRLREALQYVERKDSADSLDQHLRHLESQDVDRMHAGYALVRIIVWAIPILGLLGTVIGITMAIANLNPETLERSMADVTRGLGVAFDHTGEALTLTMVLMFAKHGVERFEVRLLNLVDARAVAELTGRFEYMGTDGDPNVASIRRMSEQVISAVESLASRQAEIWKSSIDQTHEQWAEASASAGQIVRESLASALRDNLELHAQRLNEGVLTHADRLSRNSDDTVAHLREGLEKLAELLVESLHRHGEVLTLSEKDLAEENRRHLSEVEGALSESMVVAADRQEKLIKQSENLLKEMQDALVNAAEATIRQQEQLVKQGDVLLQVVDATGQVRSLEESLNNNLAALAQSQRFDEMALNLSAAVQMLCARIGYLPGRPIPAGEPSAKKPASHAA